MQLTGAEITIRCLQEEGVEYVFGYPGGAVLNIYDELFKQDKVKHVLVRHEQGAVHAADGYSRSSHKVGVALVCWQHEDIAAIAKQLQENRVEFKGPDDGSRKRPDGRVLNWKTINLADDRQGLLPFFIEWSADSVHPSKDAPAKCTLDYFEILSDDPEELSSALKRIGLDLPVQRSDKARLHALISGPKGDIKLST